MPVPGIPNVRARRVPGQEPAATSRAETHAGVVRAEGEGRVSAHRLDAAHPLAPAIGALFAAEAARVDRALDAVRPGGSPQPTRHPFVGPLARR